MKHRMVSSEICAIECPVAVAEAAANRRRWLGLAVLLAGSFMTVLDAMIVQLALPSIARDLGAGSAAIELIIAGYSLAYGVLLVTGGRLGDMFGRKRVYLIGMAAFTLASILCGLAPNAAMLVAARVLQGATASLVLPQVLASIRVGYDGDERRRAFGLMGLVMGAASALGQLAGGVLISGDVFGLGWRLVFLVNLPIGILAVLAGLRWLDESKAPHSARLDPFGILLSTAGLACLLGGLVGLHQLGLAQASVLALVSIPLFLWFGRHESRFEERGAMPLFSIRLLKLPAFIFGALAVLVFYASCSSYYVSFAVFLQFGLGFTPLHAGMLFTPIAGIFAATSILAPRLIGRYGTLVLRVSALVYAIGYAVVWLMLARSGAEPSLWLLMPVMLVVAAVQGFIMTPLLNVVLGALPESHAGMAGGSIATMQQVGNALGIAVIGLVLFAAASGGAVGSLHPAEAVIGFGNAVLLEFFAALAVYALLRRLR
jgi:EmrB/QacA subfamily drug resistance transporter